MVVEQQSVRTRLLTSEDLKFCQDRRELVVVDPIVGLMLGPQSSEGFIVQIKLCVKKTGVNGRGRATVFSVMLKIRCCTAAGDGFLHLFLSNGGLIPLPPPLHVLPPDHGHIVLQFEDLHRVQVSRLVCLKGLVKDKVNSSTTPELVNSHVITPEVV